MMNKIALSAAAAIIGCAIGMTANLPLAHAAKVDCDAVMGKLNGGEKPRAVAKEMGISASSVYRCRKKAKDAEKAGGGAGGGSSPAAETSPAAMPPAAPASPKKP